MGRLTKRQQEEIVALYASGEISQRAIAEKYQVSRSAIAKLLKQPERAKSIQEVTKKRQESMQAFLDGQRGSVQEIIAAILGSARKDIAEASLRDKMGALKVLAEVFRGKGEEEAGDGGSAVTFEIVDVGIKRE